MIETGRVNFWGLFPLKTLLEESFPEQARLTVACMLASDWAPITDKHSSKSWNCLVMSAIPRALSPVLENFHRRFSWPNWPPLGLRGWAILSLWNFMPLTTQCRAPQVIQQSVAQSNRVSPVFALPFNHFFNLQRKIQSADKGVIIVCHERERNKKFEIPAGFEPMASQTPGRRSICCTTRVWKASWILLTPD